MFSEYARYGSSIWREMVLGHEIRKCPPAGSLGVLVANAGELHGFEDLLAILLEIQT
jgi:hypothetical protein